MKYTMTDLEYDFNALEPYIDAKTMEIHYTKHHAGYTNNLNNAMESLNGKYEDINELLSHVSDFPVAIRNNGGGYFNHNLFWKILSPKGSGVPEGELKNAIDTAFGSFNNFKNEFNSAALGRFGSGWAWLIKDNAGKLKVVSTPNQDNPLMDIAEEREHQSWQLTCGSMLIILSIKTEETNM
ncbi:MAG: superoxide dismutase [Marinilabiliales bacterium]